MILLLALPAFADIGPPPTCPAGKHREYLYGHKCVDDGFHLVAKEGGGVEQVPDAPKAEPTVPPTADTPATTTPAATPIPEVAPTPAATPPAAPAPEKPKGGCSTAPGTTTGLGLLFALALGGRRRR